MRAFIHLPETGDNYWDTDEEFVLSVRNIEYIESKDKGYLSDNTTISLRDGFYLCEDNLLPTQHEYENIVYAINKANAGLALEKQISGNLEDKIMFICFNKPGKNGISVMISVDKITHMLSAGKNFTQIATPSGEVRVKGSLAETCQKLAAAGCVIEKVKVKK